jgi:peroxin-6
MLKAIERKIKELEIKVKEANIYQKRISASQVTARHYLEEIAGVDESDVVIEGEDFVAALEDLVPSVSSEEMAHYTNVKRIVGN